jgi:hypothetical protein
VTERLLRWLGCIDEREKLVRVKSWWPSWDRHGIGWPTLLLDKSYCRVTATRIWQLRK